MNSSALEFRDHGLEITTLERTNKLQFRCKQRLSTTTLLLLSAVVYLACISEELSRFGWVSKGFPKNLWGLLDRGEWEHIHLFVQFISCICVIFYYIILQLIDALLKVWLQGQWAMGLSPFWWTVSNKYYCVIQKTADLYARHSRSFPLPRPGAAVLPTACCGVILWNSHTANHLGSCTVAFYETVTN